MFMQCTGLVAFNGIPNQLVLINPKGNCGIYRLFSFETPVCWSVWRKMALHPHCHCPSCHQGAGRRCQNCRRSLAADHHHVSLKDYDFKWYLFRFITILKTYIHLLGVNRPLLVRIHRVFNVTTAVAVDDEVIFAVLSSFLLPRCAPCASLHM